MSLDPQRGADPLSAARLTTLGQSSTLLTPTSPRERWRDVLTFVGVIFLVLVALFFVWQSKKAGKIRDEERQHILTIAEDLRNLTAIQLEDQRATRCRTEQLHALLLEKEGIPIPPNPFHDQCNTPRLP